MDLAFDRVLSTGAVPPPPSIREADVPVERDAPADTGIRPVPDLGALTLDLEPEEKLDLPPAVELETPPGEPPAVEPPESFPGEGGFLISDSDTLDFLQEKHRDADSEPPSGVGDISLELSSAPADEVKSFLREPNAPPTTSAD
ncbi:MAG TPA: hypothetical protein VIU83_02930, partial [Candidatus Deferrimicrobium sp.]